jgi:hypothetical protein
MQTSPGQRIMANSLRHAWRRGITPRGAKMWGTDMTRRDGKLLTRLHKHLRIGLGAFAMMLLAASLPGPGGVAELVEVAHASEMASSGVVGALHMIGAELALSEPVYRGTDRGDAILILVFVFSGIVAFNFWFSSTCVASTPPHCKAVAGPQTADSPPRAPSSGCQSEGAPVAPPRV